ncbi:cbb3-type cytochrome oxidase assembly protein CcoS [Geomonas oryzae]|uniref:cbb3-type cytochrome oxidase assembly protein CcoS n=1 Tax=Geomonas oryzae TaxID=2364273 RepID=UPI00100B3774|nr:cbb3-type cytochrome oxidase assembly protein CcoS [Geomonas oryzae]
MNNPLDSTAFVLIWIGFPLLVGSVAALFFFWGMRNGQFADQERARYLPLESGCEEEPPTLPDPRRTERGCREVAQVPASAQPGRHETGLGTENGAGGTRPC